MEDVEVDCRNLLETSQVRTLIVCCDKIILSQSSLELDIEIPNEKIKNIDCLVINGFKFTKDTGE